MGLIREEFPKLVFSLIIVIFFVFFEISRTINYVKYPTPPFELSAIISGLGTLMSLILTGGLLYLYKIQSSTLDSQTTLLEYEQTSIPKINTIGIPSLSDSQEYQDNNGGGMERSPQLYHSEAVEFDISNMGPAPATELKAEMIVRSSGREFSTVMPVFDCEWEQAFDRLLNRDTAPIFYNQESNCIMSEEKGKKFSVVFSGMKSCIPDQWMRDAPVTSYNPSPSSVPRYANWNNSVEIEVSILLWFRDGRGYRGPRVLRYVKLEEDELVDSSNVSGFDKISERMSDLSEMIESESIDQVDPDINTRTHPDER